MIGRVQFTCGGRDHAATLRDDGTWTIRPPLPTEQGILNALCAPPHDYTSADGEYGHPQLHKAAEILKGTLYIKPVPKYRPDAIL